MAQPSSPEKPHTIRQIAHDLNNAVGTIWLNLHSLKKACAKLPSADPEITSTIQTVESETRTIAALASKLSAIGPTMGPTVGTEQSQS